MSASLVGSEMCIRDRPLPLHKMIDVQFPDSGGGTDPDVMVGFRSSAINCLLYTSDAADDM
eukprot:9010261-Alexandrium_andersonii.AAC.1